jgi:hypothetical protein
MVGAIPAVPLHLCILHRTTHTSGGHGWTGDDCQGVSPHPHAGNSRKAISSFFTSSRSQGWFLRARPETNPPGCSLSIPATISDYGPLAARFLRLESGNRGSGITYRDIRGPDVTADRGESHEKAGCGWKG